MKTVQNGKGSKPRPCKYSKFYINFDNIKWPNKKPSKNENKS